MFLIKAGFNVFLFTRFLVIHQDLEWVSPDLGFGFNVGALVVHQKIGDPIKGTSDDQICSEVVFVVLGRVIWVLMSFMGTCASRVFSLSKVSAWVD